MLQKKICMLGGFSVGKTSLIRRFVHSKFSDEYLTSIGVKVDKKVVSLKLPKEVCEVTLMLWDIAGEDDYFSVPDSYLRGAHGLFFVVDGTRASTVAPVLALHERTQTLLGAVPQIVVVNKDDLRDRWQLGEQEQGDLSAISDILHRTSAKEGRGVDEAFAHLAEASLG